MVHQDQRPAGTLALPKTISDVQSCAASLASWTETQYLPKGLTLADLDELLPIARQEIAGMDVAEFGVLLDQLFTFARTFEIKDFSEEKAINATKIYRKALIDLPADLFDKAIKEAIATHKYGMRLPLPSELRKIVAVELNKRHAIVARLKAARERGREEPPPQKPRTPEELERVRNIVAECRRSLSAEKTKADD